jgi:hypothetical protein
MPRALVTYWNLHRISILMLLLSTVLYAAFAYDLERTDSFKLLTLYGALFFFCFKLIQFEKLNYRFLVAGGIVLRGVFLLAEPNLSQDVYRFIWDGNLTLLGMNPYQFSPDQLMQSGNALFPLAEKLHEGMGGLSSRNFSNYPPVNQYLFALCVKAGGQGFLSSIIAMRLLIVLADLGVLYFGRKLLRKLNKAPYLIFWYFLNPLIIIELSGNLHFEGVMLFFFILALYLMIQFSWFWGVLPYALSIGVKLVPLMLLPLMLPLLGWRRAAGFYILTGLLLAASVYPLYFPDFGLHYSQTLKLWFSNFEFNAGLYSLAERIAVWQDAKPWEFIAVYGRWIPWITAGTAVVICLHPKMQNPKSWFTGALAVLTVFYLSTATVHPWYLAFPLLLSLFTRMRFMLLWSALVFISYTAYSEEGVEEQPLLLLLEYSAVIGMLLYELFRNRNEFFALGKISTRKSSD